MINLVPRPHFSPPTWPGYEGSKWLTLYPGHISLLPRGLGTRLASDEIKSLGASVAAGRFGEQAS